jgi:hypothetical protein
MEHKEKSSERSGKEELRESGRKGRLKIENS